MTKLHISPGAQDVGVVRGDLYDGTSVLLESDPGTRRSGGTQCELPRGQIHHRKHNTFLQIAALAHEVHGEHTPTSRVVNAETFRDAASRTLSMVANAQG